MLLAVGFFMAGFILPAVGRYFALSPGKCTGWRRGEFLVELGVAGVGLVVLAYAFGVS